MEDFVSFGGWIRHRRKQLDMTQQELADRVHCSINTIKKIEGDARRPSRQLASLLVVQLRIPESQRLRFLEVARGLRRSVSLKVQDVAETQVEEERVKSDLYHAWSFVIGRDSEMTLLMQLLKDSRLVTITGPGGVGKSTLAQAVAEKYQSQNQRAIYIPLVGVSTVEHVPFSIASVLGLDIPFRADPLKQIVAYLANKKMLLVVDNFEHLLEGTAILGQIIQKAPGVTLLVTSRERLRLPEEQNFPLQGLRYPEEEVFAGDVSMYPAIALFVRHARKINPDYSLEDKKDLVQICRISEGMPLALEMLASWTDVIPLKSILPELIRSFDMLANSDSRVTVRHRSMRAVFDASWQMLGKAERGVFTRLCVFRGGFTRQAADAIAGASWSILSMLAGRSMIKLDYESGRYSIHSLLRYYGEERLQESSLLENVQQSHAHYFFDLAKTAHSYLHGSEQEHWFDCLDADRDNVRGALSFLFSHAGQENMAGRMVLALSWYWRIRSRVVEALKWLEHALKFKNYDIETLAGLYYHAGHFGWMQGDAVSALTRQLQSLELWESLGEKGVRGKAYSYQSLGMIADLENDHEKAIKEYLASIHLFEDSGDRWGSAFARHRLGGTLLALGRLDDSHEQFQLSEKYFRECGDRWALGLVLGYFARMEFHKGNLSLAREYAEETRNIREDFGHTHSVIEVTDFLSQVALQLGDKTTARELLENILELSNELGNQQFVDGFSKRLAELNT